MKSLIFETVFIGLATVVSFGTLFSAKADCLEETPWVDLTVVENQSLARIWIYRGPDANSLQTMEYFTVDGPPNGAPDGTPSYLPNVAREGVDYVRRRGTATFAVGQRETSLDIPILDNGLLDGVRDFSLVLTNLSPGLQLVSGRYGNTKRIRIEDNEVGTGVDPLFVPDRSHWPYLLGATALSMPDGRILVSRVDQGLQLLMFKSTGWVDADFSTHLATHALGLLMAYQVMDDGRILARGIEETPTRIIRLFPDGTLDAVIPVANFTGFSIAQPDGRILVIANPNGASLLKRLNQDGSADSTFKPLEIWNQIAVQTDGKILIGFTNSLFRLNTDGSPDATFSSPALTNAASDIAVSYIWPRHNGKVLISDGWSLTQLNEYGGIDANGLPAELAVAIPFNGPAHNPPQVVNSFDGQLFMAIEEELPDIVAIGTIARWNPDGSRGPNLALTIGGPRPEACGRPPLRIGIAGTNRLVVTGGFNKVDGFPRPGFARLFTNPPERDFRVLTPAESFRSSGVARVYVLRTGPSTNAASVSFTTRDATAKAGVDYVAQSSTLDFAPLEVSKEVMVPLLSRTGADQWLIFNVELNNPSVGYTNIASTPIAILPDLRVAADSLWAGAVGSLALTLRGTVPGRYYALESSTDLKNWQWAASAQAIGNTVTFENLARGVSQFFRGRTE